MMTVSEENALFSIKNSIAKIAKQLEIANKLKTIEIEKSFVNYHNEVEKTYKDFEDVKKELEND